MTDFGLAKTEEDGLTRTGDLLGTFRYMAPERFQGESDGRSDVYALGLTLYELLVLRPAFDAPDRLRVMALVKEQEPPSPRSLDPRIPRDLETIVLTAIAKDPRRRYQTADEMAADLLHFLSGEPIRARRVRWLERTWLWARRNPTRAALGATVAVLVLTVAIGLPVTALVKRERDQAVASQARAEQAEEEANALQRRAERAEQENMVRAHLGQAGAHRRSGQVGQRFQSLAELTAALKLDPSPELRREIRDEAAAALVLADVQIAYEWQGWPEGTIALVFDATLKRFARIDKQGGVAIGRVTETGEEVVASLPASGRPPSPWVWMSPDGRFVLVWHGPARAGAGKAFSVWKLDWQRADLAPNRLFTEEDPTGSNLAVAFRPDGRQLAVRHAGGLSIYDLATGVRTWRFALAGPSFHLAFHPRGDTLAVVSGAEVILFDAATGREQKRLRHDEKVTEITHLAWHPDGRRLAVACDDVKIHLWDADAGREVMPGWTGHANLGIRMAFNHAGDRLVSIDWDRQTLLWDAASGQVLLTMPGPFGTQFSHDDGLLGPQRSGSTVRLWRVNAGRELHVLRQITAEGWLREPVPDAEGRVLSVLSQRGLLFFDLASGEELASVRLPQPGSTWLRCFISPGGWVMSKGGVGTLFWPIQLDHDQPHLLRVGPPRHLSNTGQNGASASPDGAVLVLANGDSAIVQHRDRPHQRFVLKPQPDVRHTAVSPDKRWVVTCSFHGVEPNPWVRIWNAQTGGHVHDLPLHDTTWAWFSPDSRWLATKTLGEDCRLWEVGTWREVRSYPEADVAFSPDERTMALDDVHGQVRLVEIASDREIARLTGPEPIWYAPASFSPDGTRLIATTRDKRGAVYIWDMRLIRHGLKEMGLDWELPEFPPAPPPGRPLQVLVDGGFLQQDADFPDPRHAVAAYTIALAHLPLNPGAYLQRGLAHGRLNQPQQAVADYSMFLALTPSNDPRRAEILYRRSQNYVGLKDHAAELRDLLEMASLNLDRMPWPSYVALRCNNVAWELVKGPEKDRQPNKALTLALKAMELAPDNCDYRNTLGVVYYRAGRHRDAITTLESNLEANAEFAAFDLYFLAMSCHQLGEVAKAKDYLDRAIRWHDQKRAGLPQNYQTELKLFREEAEELLGIKEKK